MTTTLEKPREVSTFKRRRMATDVADLLAIWQYAEYSAMRVITGWSRDARHWDDKMQMCYSAYLQSQNVDKLRNRLAMFPGNPDAPVSGRFETALNTLFLAPDWDNAMGALHQILYPLLNAAYESYIQNSNPIHDAPTHEILREIVESKTSQVNWYQTFQSRDGFQMNIEYSMRVRDALNEVENFQTPITPSEPYAKLVGKNTDFRQNAAPGRVPDSDLAPEIMPFFSHDWSHSVEARRLFFTIGYFWEMGVAENQLRWLFYADFMPWEFVRDEARHMWDESRHGNSGLARLRDFGLDVKDVGYSSYGAANASGTLSEMTPHDVYEAFYGVTQIAETGYFKTKGYCFEDFRDGGDAQSAEMMQFDIIDETSHTEYGRQWLDVMKTRAGADEDYRLRGTEDRHRIFERVGRREAALHEFLYNGTLPDDEEIAREVQHTATTLKDETARAHYEKLLAVLRAKCPLTNAQTAPIRPHLPM